jgi:hypothetical protein
VLQLTTDKQHEDARRFYEKLGFVATQVGMKLQLSPTVHSGATAQENGKIRP